MKKNTAESLQNNDNTTMDIRTLISNINQMNQKVCFGSWHSLYCSSMISFLYRRQISNVAMEKTSLWGFIDLHKHCSEINPYKIIIIYAESSPYDKPLETFITTMFNNDDATEHLITCLQSAIFFLTERARLKEFHKNAPMV